MLKTFSNLSNKNRIILEFILFLGLLLRITSLRFFNFDYDQAIPAQAAYDFFVNHKLTLIGQELSFSGLFLGPVHSWLQFIPYGVCNLKPDCVPFFFTAIGVLTLILIYYFVKPIFSNKIAIISTMVFSFSFLQILYELNVNSNFLILLSTLVLLFSLYKFLSGKKAYLIVGAFVAGIATVNFNPIFIFSTIAYFMFGLIFSKERYAKVFVLAIIAFFVNYLPLIMFNLRHGNILLHGFSNFIGKNVENLNIFYNLYFIFVKILAPFYSNFLFSKTEFVYQIITVILIIIGIKTIGLRRNFQLFLPFWILINSAGLAFYKGHIPDYYFIQTLLPFAVIISYAVSKNVHIFLIFITIFSYSNIQQILRHEPFLNYKNKKNIVKLIISSTEQESFTVYYETPLGFNNGYDYLLKIYDKQPTADGKNVYVLAIGDTAAYKKLKYRKKVPERNVDDQKINDQTYLILIK